MKKSRPLELKTTERLNKQISSPRLSGAPDTIIDTTPVVVVETVMGEESPKFFFCRGKKANTASPNGTRTNPSESVSSGGAPEAPHSVPTLGKTLHRYRSEKLLYKDVPFPFLINSIKR
jgi:hypothetical protein